MIEKINLFHALPDAKNAEVLEDLLRHENVRIERITSSGQITPEGEWYDQKEHEWVLLLQGAARLEFKNPFEEVKGAGMKAGQGKAGDRQGGTREVALVAGDYVNIPAGCRHRVSWTDPAQLTVWLAVFYR
ncbi:cupin [Microbulbifer sp. ALW1]|uniref:cupin n=1 Tax=Microbulbifer sp. (strain ALW1) TaxID=1516059 RepID=UPI0019120E79|nr:cupin [Microbulbifer sp. ALW1]